MKMVYAKYFPILTISLSRSKHWLNLTLLVNNKSEQYPWWLFSYIYYCIWARICQWIHNKVPNARNKDTKVRHNLCQLFSVSTTENCSENCYASSSIFHTLWCEVWCQTSNDEIRYQSITTFCCLSQFSSHSGFSEVTELKIDATTF